MDNDRKDRLIDQTIEVWQPRTSRKLSREDGREIAENTVGFFQTLRRWSEEASANGVVDESTATQVDQHVEPRQGSQRRGEGGQS